MTILIKPVQNTRWSAFSRLAGRLDIVTASALAAGLALIWYMGVFQMPTSLWGVPLDPPVMSLAQAVNIDFWLREPGPRALSQAQYYQPGLWYQFASYAAYRAVGGSGSPEQLFDAAMRDPQSFWNVLRTLPLILSFMGMALTWRMSRGIGALARSIALVSYFVCSATLTFGTTLFFNESITLILAAIYFAAAFSVLADNNARPVLSAVVCGLAGAILYLHKMNYIAWSLALVPALLAGAALGRFSWKSAFLRVTVMVAAAVIGVLLLGYVLLTPSGLRQMLESHREIILGSGIYGQGARTVISPRVVLSNLKDVWIGEMSTLLFLGLSMALAAFAIVRHARDRAWLLRTLPEGVLVFAAAAVTLLAVLKHFQGYYVVAVSAVFPFLVIWLARAGYRHAFWILAAIVAYSVVPNVTGTLAQQRQWAADERDVLADNKAILARPLVADSVRLWMYRVIDPIGQRLFLVSFTGLDRLMSNLVELQGPQFFASPWHANIATAEGMVPMGDVPWSEIVVSRDTMPWINAQSHPWINDPKVTATELKKVILFERHPAIP